MSQMSETLARSVLEDYALGDRHVLTQWEVVQLAWFWLKHNGYEVPERIKTPSDRDGESR